MNKYHALFLFFYLSQSFAQYDILLENNTPHTFIIDTGSPSPIKLNAHGGLHHETLHPYERKQVQWVNYNTDIKNHHLYQFYINLYGDAEQKKPLLHFDTWIRGNLFGSTIERMSLTNDNKEYVLKDIPPSPHNAEINARTVPSPFSSNIPLQIYATSIKYANPNPHYYLQSVDGLAYVINERQSHFNNSDNEDELTLLTYNTQIWPTFASAGGLILNHPERRTFHIAGQTIFYDVVAYQEVFDNTLRQVLIDSLLKHYPFHVRPASNGNVFTSGVSLHSRYPITLSDNYIFEHCAGFDCGAAKGISYARIQKGKRTYHVFATHLDATLKTIRARQLVELKQYIKHFHIPRNEAVVVMGDLNIDSYPCLSSQQNCDEFDLLLNKLKAHYQVHDNYAVLPVTFSSQLDWMVTEKGKNESLDYILPLKDYRPVKKFHSRVRVIRADNDANMYTGTPYGDTDLSDHFALEAKINY